MNVCRIWFACYIIYLCQNHYSLDCVCVLCMHNVCVCGCIYIHNLNQVHLLQKRFLCQNLSKFMQFNNSIWCDMKWLYRIVLIFEVIYRFNNYKFKFICCEHLNNIYGLAYQIINKNPTKLKKVAFK
jgi:hypothetical protein